MESRISKLKLLINVRTKRAECWEMPEASREFEQGESRSFYLRNLRDGI